MDNFWVIVAGVNALLCLAFFAERKFLNTGVHFIAAIAAVFLA
jgi:hypothetical protein